MGTSGVFARAAGRCEDHSSIAAVVSYRGVWGHKQRLDLVGPVVRDDIPLFGGVDTVRQQGGRIADAERRLARLWAADWGRISVGGSTHGNQALALALLRPGDEVIVTRTLHRSLLLAH